MTKMSETRLIELLEAYGADPAAWPDDERAAGAALLAEHPARAETARTEADTLDAALAELPRITLPKGLITHILASAPPPRTSLVARLSVRIFPEGARWPAGTALASLVLGTLVGTALPSMANPTDLQAEAIFEAAFDAGRGYDFIDEASE